MPSDVEKTARAFCDELQRRIATLLATHGFEVDVPETTFRRQRAIDLKDTVALLIDFRLQTGNIVCTANVGVCSPDPLADELRLRSGRRATLTWNIGYLMPGRKWHEWEVHDLEDISPTVDAFATELETVALPWLARFQTADDVRQEQKRLQPRGFGQLKRPVRRRAHAS